MRVIRESTCFHSNLAANGLGTELKALELQLEAYISTTHLLRYQLNTLGFKLRAFVCPAQAFPRKRETFSQASEPHPTQTASLEFRLQGLGYLDADLQLQFHGLQFRFKRPIH